MGVHLFDPLLCFSAFYTNVQLFRNSFDGTKIILSRESVMMRSSVSNLAIQPL